MKNRMKILGAGAAAVIVIAILVFSGISGRHKADFDTEPVLTETTEAFTEPELPLSEEEYEVVKKIYDSMEEDQYAEAAAAILENEELIRNMLKETLHSERTLFYMEETEHGPVRNMRPLTQEETAKGMVFSKFNTVFLGTYRDGLPYGKCTAVQAMILDHPRYTYSRGIFHDGKMNGKGETGHCYYEGKKDGNYESVSKAGTFHDNLMTGDILYTADDGDGGVLTWKLQAFDGVTVIDDSWFYYSYGKQYMLGSEEDKDRVYVIPEETKDQVRWSNLISWEEQPEN